MQLQFLHREVWTKTLMPALEMLYRLHFYCFYYAWTSVDMLTVMIKEVTTINLVCTM